MFEDELVNQKLDFLPWGGPAVVRKVPAERTKINIKLFMSDTYQLRTVVRRYWDIEEPKETLIVNPHYKFASDTC